MSSLTPKENRTSRSLIYKALEFRGRNFWKAGTPTLKWWTKFLEDLISSILGIDQSSQRRHNLVAAKNLLCKLLEDPVAPTTRKLCYLVIMINYLPRRSITLMSATHHRTISARNLQKIKWLIGHKILGSARNFWLCYRALAPLKLKGEK